MNKYQMIDLLNNALSSDYTIRANAENIIINLQNNNFASFLRVLLEIFDEEVGSIPPHRISSGILLKNSLHSADPATQHQIETNWMCLDMHFREEMKATLLKNMRSTKLKIALMSAGVVASIARIELIRGSFQNFFIMMHSLLNEGDAILSKAILEGTGITATYLIEETSYDFSSNSSVIFNMIIIKLKKEEGSDVRMYALKCLSSSLEGLESVMESHQDAKLLLTAVIDSADDDEEFISYSVECLYTILGLYYGRLVQCIDIPLEYVKMLMTRDSEKISMQVIEFWSVIAEIEAENGGMFVENNLLFVLNYLLHKLRKSEDHDIEGWDTHKAATACIENISKCTRTDLIDFKPFYTFVMQNIHAQDQHQQDVGTIALGAGINARIEDCNGILRTIVPLVVANIKKEELKASSLWALSKICENNFSIVDPGLVLPELVQNTIQVVQENSRHSVYAAYLIANMCSCLASERNKTWDYENHLSFFYFDILDVLVKATEAVDARNFKLRRALFSALTELISAASENVSSVLDDLLKYIICRTQEYLKHQNNQEYFLIIEDLISNYIVLVQNIVLSRKEEHMGNDAKEQIIGLFLEILNCRQSYIYGDVYITLSVLCTPVSYFTLNVNSFIPFLLRDLKSTDFYVLKAVVNLVGDIANSLNQGFLVYSEHLVPELIQCLISANTQRDLKPTLLSVFGDVALSLGASFCPYLDMTMHIIVQITSFQRKFNETFVDNLRKNALQMVDCVIIALGNNAKIRENMRNITLFLKQVVDEDEGKRCTKECICLIGDLLRTFGKTDGLRDAWIPEYMEMCLSADDPDICVATQKSLFFWRAEN
eukprot:jgi/Antlo1/2567/678